MRKKLRFLFFLPSSIINRIIIFLSGGKLGKRFEATGIIWIRNKGILEIGNNVCIRSSASSNPIGCGWKTYIQILKNGYLIIGNGVRMSNVSITTESSIVIEDDVLIGGGCKIFDTDFHSLDYNMRLKKKKPEYIKSKEIKICKGAFIGADTIILKGSIIGEKSVIGAGSVVSGIIPNGEIWGGNPAVFLKKIE